MMNKKIDLLVKNTVVKNLSSQTSFLEEVKAFTDKKIQNGLKKDTAGTGTPIDDLNGNARVIAQISNIGGGSKKNGGGGVEEGFKTVLINNVAKEKLKTIEEFSTNEKFLNEKI